jgi:hypothetical protein
MKSKILSINYFIHIIMYKISQFFRLNFIALRINHYYKFNVYLLLILFICIISSIIIRTNIINEDMLLAYFNNYDIKITMNILSIFAIIYCLKLIFDIFIKGIQAFKTIPEFISLYKTNVINIKSIISLYYIQNIILILLSCWIFYNIIVKLNLFIDNIYIYILFLGIIISLTFIYYYPLKEFTFDINNKGYSIWIYLLLLFTLFYIFIVPLIVINIINSDKIIQFKENFIEKCIQNTKPNFMDNNPNESSSSVNHSIIRGNLHNNKFIIPDNNYDQLKISDNLSNNVIEVVRRDVTVNNNYNIETMNINRPEQLQVPEQLNRNVPQSLPHTSSFDPTNTERIPQSRNNNLHPFIIPRKNNILLKYKSLIDLTDQYFNNIGVDENFRNIFTIPHKSLSETSLSIIIIIFGGFKKLIC